MKKILFVILVLSLLSFSAFAFTATRTISGNTVTVNVNPEWTNIEYTPSINIIETLSGGAKIITPLPANAACGKSSSDTVLTCTSTQIVAYTLVYSTSGSGTVKGEITGKESTNPTGPSTQKLITGESTIPQTAACVSVWETSDWSTCVNGVQTRTVTDKNKCDLANPTKIETQDCVPPSVCNNGQVEPGEACDNTNFMEQTCVSLGYESGSLTCSFDCKSITDENCVSKPVDDDPKGEDLTIKAGNSKEKSLFLQIQKALSTNDSILKKVSAIAGAFKCFFDNACEFK